MSQALAGFEGPTPGVNDARYFVNMVEFDEEALRPGSVTRPALCNSSQCVMQEVHLSAKGRDEKVLPVR